MLSERMRRENRSIVLFLLLPPRAHFVLGKHFANVKLVHWQQVTASTQVSCEKHLSLFRVHLPRSLTTFMHLQYQSKGDSNISSSSELEENIVFDFAVLYSNLCCYL